MIIESSYKYRQERLLGYQFKARAILRIISPDKQCPLAKLQMNTV